MSKQTKTVTLSIVHPVSVTVSVSRDNDDEDWQIDHIKRAECDATVRSIEESMTDEDFDNLQSKASS